MRLKYIPLFTGLLFFIIHNIIIAQEPDVLWTQTYGGSDWDVGFDVQQTFDGGYIIAGYTQSYGPSDYNVYLIKTDGGGNELWTKVIGGSDSQMAHSIRQTSDGGYIITGRSWVAGYEDIYLLKTDPEGIELWSKTFGRPNISGDVGWSVQLTSDGGYIITGSYYNVYPTYQDVYLMKTNANGEPLWIKTFDGSDGNDVGYSVQQTADDGFIIVGSTTVDNSPNVWLIKTDQDGTKQWSRIFGESGVFSTGYSVQQTIDGGYILTGYKSINYSYNLWLIKTDPFGNELWNKIFTGNDHTIGKDVKPTDDGGYIVTGTFRTESETEGAVYVIKTDSDGNLQWSKTIGESGFGSGQTIHQTIDGGYIIGGVRVWPITEDRDVYLIKLGESSKIVRFYNNYLNNLQLLVETNTSGGSDIPAKICADGSDVTLIGFWGNYNMDEIEFVIQEDPNGTNSEEYGSLSILNQTQESKFYKYTHPIITNASFAYREINLTVKNNSTVVYNYPMHIYRAPVLMVHGLWSNNEAFEEMENNLVQSNLWVEDLLYRSDYSLTSGEHFLVNKDVVSNDVINLINLAIDNKYSVGKVNVLGHSMGGLLTRIYLQSLSYRDDICRFITLNSPHSGSQMANLFTDYLDFAFLEALGFGHTVNAVKDLQVDSDAILNLLNGQENLNRNTVPSRVFTSTSTVNEVVPWGTLLVSFLEANFPNFNVQTTVNDIFNNDFSDIIVALESQQGGLETESWTSPQWHIGSPSNPNIINEVMIMLNQNLNDPFSFTTDGFNPPVLEYNFNPGNATYVDWTIQNNPEEGFLTIINPPGGSILNSGEEFQVDVNGSADISKIIIVLQSRDWDPFFEVINSNSGSTNLLIPIKSASSVRVFAGGFNESGYVASDTITLSINISSNLDSIIASPEKLFIPRSNIASIRVTGYFSDGIQRNLNFHPGVEYDCENNIVATFIEPGLIMGLLEDTTNAVISFDEDTSLISVVVLPPDIITTVDEGDSEKSKNIYSTNILQNYPNPFNPVTTIKYSINYASKVTLKIFNVLGQEITVLVDGDKQPGDYEVVFDASHIPSGVYLYKLQTDSFINTRKMVLIK